MLQNEKLKKALAYYVNDDTILECKITLLCDKRKLLKEYNRLDNLRIYYGDYLDNWTLSDFYQSKIIEFKNNFPNYERLRFVFDKVVQSLNSSKNGKVKRVSKRINEIMQGNDAHFLTLTFTDHVLSATTKETRRSYVRRFLKENSTLYVANIDYGDDYGREHYHAVVDCFINEELWIYGIMRVRKVGRKDKDLKKVSRYVAKLSMHAVKSSAMQGLQPDRLIYSRK